MKKFIKKLNEFLPQSMQMNNPGIKEPGIKTPPKEKPKRGPLIKPAPGGKPEATVEELIDKFADSIMELDEMQGLENIPEYNELLSVVFGNNPGVKDPGIKTPPKEKPKRGPLIKPSPNTKPEAFGLPESFNIKSFSQFVNEARHEDNPAFPEEYKRGWMQAISDNARQLQQRIGGRPIQLPMPELIQMINFIQSGYELDLEQLAEDVIVEFYGSLLDNVELRIKLGAPPKSMQDELETEMITPEEITDRRTIGEIHRRKVGRMMMQAEAKGSKQLFNFAVERLTELFASKDLNSAGPNNRIASQIEQLMTRNNLDLGQLYIILLNQLGDIADISDLTVPEMQMASFWKGGSPAGMVQVSWESGDSDKDEDAAQKVLDSLEAGEEPDAEDIEEFFDGDKAIIKVYGNDFGMLLHETIKGIWKLIINSALPSDPGEEELTDTILRNTDDIYNEINELKFGNRFKQSITEFINTRFSTPLTVSLDNGKRVSIVPTDVPNFKERLFGMMIMEPNPYTFIKMIIAILSKNYSRRGMFKIDAHAYAVVKMEAEYEAQTMDWELGQGSQFDIPSYGGVQEEPEEELDYSSMSKREIEQEIDSALDAGDMEKVRMLAQYLKEAFNIDLFY